MRTRIWVIISLLLSIISVSFVSFRIEPVTIDWLGVLVGILAMLVAVLIGWQIYNVININQTVRTIEEAKNDFDKKKSTLMSEFETKIIALENQRKKLEGYIKQFSDAVNSKSVKYKYRLRLRVSSKVDIERFQEDLSLFTPKNMVEKPSGAFNYYEILVKGPDDIDRSFYNRVVSLLKIEYPDSDINYTLCDEMRQ